MALVTKNFTLNVTPGAMPPTVHVSEYDVGRTYTITLLGENGSAFEIPTDTTATVEGTLNGTVGFTTSATISNNQITFALTESMTAYAGKAWCKVKLTLNDEPIQTCAFVLAVDRAGVEADTVIGAPGFEEQIQNAVDAWIEQNPPDYGIDPTLSISGEAADAAATGKIKEKLVFHESNNLSKSDSDWIVGYIVSNTNGNLVASSALSTSDYIPVNVGDVIRLYDLSGGTFGNREMRAIATYDANKTAVSNPDSTGWRQYSYTVVDGIKYVRVSALNASQYMITKNYTPTVFEPWFEPHYVATNDFIADAFNDLIADQPFFTLPEGGQLGQALLSDGVDGAVWGNVQGGGNYGEITEKLTLKHSQNLSGADSDWTDGYYVSNATGNIAATSGLSYSILIPVDEGDVIRLFAISRTTGSFTQSEMRTVATYDVDGNNVSNPDSTGWKVNSYTVASGIKFVRVSATTQTNYMVTKNYIPTAYEPYYEPYYVATDEFVEDALTDLTADQLKNGFAFALPQTIFRQTVGMSQTWYKKSMITPPSEFVYVRGGETGTTTFADKVTFANASAKNSANGYIWYAYDPYFNLLKKYDAGTGYGSSAKVIAENLQDCTVLVIGDSTVDAGDMTGSMLSYFTSKGKTLTLLGTLSENGNPLNRNEGRAGWNTADYMTNSTNNGYTNPFYNSSTGTFDFSYYMAQQGYSGVDFVVIQLGINDLYPPNPLKTTEPDYDSIWANMAAMISSIKAYNNSTKVIINLPTTPNSDPTKHGICEFLYRHWVVRYNEYALAKIKDYGTASVRASYCHLILDPATDIRDNVHPTAAGYEKMALELINQINVWQDGA